MAALAEVGVEVESVWDLVNSKDDHYADAVPVLVEHLQDESYPDRVREGIARSVFCTVKGREIVVLITVIKKANKIQARHMEIARKRMKEVQEQ